MNEIENLTLETLEKEKLFLENKLKRKEKNWHWVKMTVWLITVLVIPVSTFFITNYQKEKEIIISKRQVDIEEEVSKRELNLKNKEMELELMSFFLKNYDKFFSDDSVTVSNIANVIATLDTAYTKNFFDKIIELSSSQNKKIFEEKQKIVLEYEKEKQKIKTVKITVIDKKNKIVPEANISFVVADSSYTGITDNSGAITFKIKNIKIGHLYVITVEGQLFNQPLNSSLTLKLR